MEFCGWQLGKLAKDIRDFWYESFEWAVFSVFDDIGERGKRKLFAGKFTSKAPLLSGSDVGCGDVILKVGHVCRRKPFYSPRVKFLKNDEPHVFVQCTSTTWLPR